MPRRDHIETNFMDRQAAENAKSGTARSIFIGLGILLLVGIGFGATQVFSYFSNFSLNQYKRNVAINLKSPRVTNGNALVSVEVKNFNAYDIVNPEIKYAIAGKEGKDVASGKIVVEGTIPAADSRNFDDVSLGPVTGQPARMHDVDVVNMTVTANQEVPKAYAARFAGAFDNKGNELITGLASLAQEKPTFIPARIAVGNAYAQMEDWVHATEEYKKAVQASPDNYNAHYHLGLALLHENKKDEGMKELQKATQLNPSDKVVAKAAASGGALPATTADTSAEEASE